MQTPLSTLREVFGYQSFRPLQEEIIEGLIRGEDCFVLMPTGGGKSLCFQIPALHRSGVCVVVSPLISLMKDQVDALRANGVSAAYFNSSQGSDEARQVLADLHNQKIKILYVAPERIVTENFLQRLRYLDIALFAIDEAHCVSQWGHDFRKEYAQLRILREQFPHVPLVALTATADNQTRADIIHQLAIPHAKQFVAGFDRPNIRYRVIEKNKPLVQLEKFLQTRRNEAGIVYCLSRKRVEEVNAHLQSKGFSALAYHAGMSAQQRQQNQDAFIRDEINIIVATVAFGMGIDKPNVRFVVHFDLPKNIEGYYQETGRAGRDGLPSEALLLYGTADIATARFLIEQTPSEEQQRIDKHKLNAMIDFSEADTCRRRVLLNYFGERQEKDCGNCDICLNPPERFDATEDARKALSCVYRVQQSFGIRHVIDVLRGAQTQRIKQLSHHQLSTHGIGKHHDEFAWQRIIRQLIHHGYLVQDVTQFSVLKLTEASRPLLRGEETLILAKPGKQEVKSENNLLSDEASALFEELRKLRKQIAQRESVPPFVIFGDASLRQMAQECPLDDESLLAINGVGQHKLAKYGQAFLDKIAEFELENEY